MKLFTSPSIIDDFYNKNKDCQVKITIGTNSKYFIAKPIKYFNWKIFLNRIYHAFLILNGNAFAVQYAEDKIFYERKIY